MKKLYLIMALCLPLALAVSSCQKDDANAATNNGGDNATGGKTLVKITDVTYSKEYDNYTLSNTSGYYHVLSFSYSNGLITGYENADYSDYGNEVHSATIAYDSQGHPTSLSAEGRTITPDINYDADGHITRVYYSYGNGWERNTFTWQNGVVTSMTKEGSEYDTPVVTTFRWENGNMVEQSQISSDSRATYTYVYDDHPSYMDSYGQLPFVMNLENITSLSRNNVIKRTSTLEYIGGTTTIYITNYIYTYGSDGYPVSFKEVEDNSNHGAYYSVRDNTIYLTYADGSGSDAPTMYEVKITDRYPGGGWIEGGGYYERGKEVMLRANNYSGYHFVQWNDSNTDNPRTFYCTGNATYSATFAAN